MTRYDVIRMAREAGITFRQMVVDGVKYEYHYVDCSDVVGGDETGCIERLAELVAARAAAAEREACAKVCSAQVQIEKYGHAAHAALMCENAIRARGTHEA